MISYGMVQEVLTDISRLYYSRILILDYQSKVVACANLSVPEIDGLIEKYNQSRFDEIENYCVKEVFDEAGMQLKFIIFIEKSEHSVVIADIISIQLSKSFRSFKDNDIEELYLRLIDGKYVDINSIIKYGKISLDEEIRVCVIQLKKEIPGEFIKKVRLEFVKEGIECVFPYIDGQLILIKKNNISVDKLKNDLRRFAEKYKKPKDLYIGIGRKVSNIADVKQSYCSAVMAISISHVNTDMSNIQIFDGMGIQQFIHSIPISYREHYLNKHTWKLSEFMSKKEIDILSLYVDAIFSVNLVVDTLKVSRKYVIKCIDKFKEITGESLSNFDVAVRFKLNLLIANSMKG